jgi:uncharacterized protein (TIGR00290 family)
VPDDRSTNDGARARSPRVDVGARIRPPLTPSGDVLSWSGGKDSMMALHRLRERRPEYSPTLVTTVTEGYERISIHGVRRALLAEQAAAIGLPLVEVIIPADCSNEEYERRTIAALAALEGQRASRGEIAFGDLFLADVRAYRERLLARTNLRGHFPLWMESTRELALEFVALRYRAVLVCVDTHALDASFAGRPFDAELLRDLPTTVDPCGENGEFHTFVYDGPLFAREVRWEPGVVVSRLDRFAYFELAEPNTAPRVQPAGEDLSGTRQAAASTAVEP